jgi:acyl-CoA reductase-like NAD-dependent aldehyde dehydrogenase
LLAECILSCPIWSVDGEDVTYYITFANIRLISQLSKKSINRFQTAISEEIQHALKNLKLWMTPEQKREEPYGVPYIYKDPLGVVLVIGPYNFPVSFF